MGKTLEDNVEQILRAEGFMTETRQRLRDGRGTPHEIDVLATKGKLLRAVECKNYSPGKPVGMEDLRNFALKLQVLGIPNGLVVAPEGFSSTAREFAEGFGIELWDREDLKERALLLLTGRAGASREMEFDLALPVRVDYSGAIGLRLTNAHRVGVVAPKLVFLPFYKVEYRLRGARNDPEKQEHAFEDDGTVLLDGISGEILNPPKSGGVLGFLRPVGGNETRAERASREAIAGVLGHEHPSARYRVVEDPRYRVNRVESQLSEANVKRLVQDAIIEWNTHTVTYRVRGGRSEGEKREMTITPRAREVSLRRLDLVHVPFWELRFEVGTKSYGRRTIATTGAVLEDQIALCPQHFQVRGFQFVKKSPLAVCEVCGRALCGEHIRQYPDGHFYCPDDTPPHFRPSNRPA